MTAPLTTPIDPHTTHQGADQVNTDGPHLRPLTLALESAYAAGQAGTAFPFRDVERKVLEALADDALATKPGPAIAPASGGEVMVLLYRRDSTCMWSAIVVENSSVATLDWVKDKEHEGWEILPLTDSRTAPPSANGGSATVAQEPAVAPMPGGLDESATDETIE